VPRPANAARLSQTGTVPLPRERRGPRKHHPDIRELHHRIIARSVNFTRSGAARYVCSAGAYCLARQSVTRGYHDRNVFPTTRNPAVSRAPPVPSTRPYRPGGTMMPDSGPRLHCPCHRGWNEIPIPDQHRFIARAIMTLRGPAHGDVRPRRGLAWAHSSLPQQRCGIRLQGIPSSVFHGHRAEVQYLLGRQSSSPTPPRRVRGVIQGRARAQT
jgi:hypothetical protein